MKARQPIHLTPTQIESWVGKYFEYKKHSGGDQLSINNPFDGDKGFHFWISTVPAPLKRDSSRINYWVHDFRGYNEFSTSFISFVKKYRKISYFEALAEVTGSKHSDLRSSLRSIFKKEEDKEEIEVEKNAELPKSESFNISDNPFKRIALNYLKSRTVSADTAIELGLRYTPDSIIFPYVEYGSVVYWQERQILNKRFNFPNEKTSGLSKTDFFYNFDNVDQPSDSIIVVESIFNCISIGDNCLASGGANIAGKQIRKLQALDPRLVVLAPDNDLPDKYGKRAGLESLKHNYFILNKLFKLAYCIPPSGYKDWNEMDQRDGVGSSRKYILNNSKALNIGTLARF